jgi:hypothetical protein
VKNKLSEHNKNKSDEKMAEASVNKIDFLTEVKVKSIEKTLLPLIKQVSKNNEKIWENSVFDFLFIYFFLTLNGKCDTYGFGNLP